MLSGTCSATAGAEAAGSPCGITPLGEGKGPRTFEHPGAWVAPFVPLLPCPQLGLRLEIEELDQHLAFRHPVTRAHQHLDDGTQDRGCNDSPAGEHAAGPPR